MKSKAILLTTVLTTCFSANALAGPECSEPKDTWLPALEMQRKILDMGYSIDLFKVTKGDCYEIYGKTTDGRKVEVYFNPASGDVLEEKFKS